MNTSGNTILITGGTSGIGLGLAEEFLKRKNKVIICGRREDRLSRIKEKNKGIETIKSDLSSEKDREYIAEEVKSKFPHLNILINNAGIQLPADLTRINLSNLQREVEINLIAPIHLTSLFIEQLKTRSESAVINISSGLAFVPLVIVPVYCATKAALHSISLSLRHQLRDTSIKVFEIIPPSVDTELGYERRKDKNQTHGGMPVHEFIDETLSAIENDIFEAPIAASKNLYEKRETLFSSINK